MHGHGRVVEYGTRLMEEPDRVGAVTYLGPDETSFLAANCHHTTIDVTGLVDLERPHRIDVVEVNGAAERWRPVSWCSRAIRWSGS